MKKTLHDQIEKSAYRLNGEIHRWDFPIEEVLAAVNRELDKGSGDTKEGIILRKLYEWIRRYLIDGDTDDFLQDLNDHLHKMQYSKYIVPPDVFPSEDGTSDCVYLANFNIDYPYEVHAANEFSRLITKGVLKKLKLCHLQDCEHIFLGPPQAKWCSPTCGSKYRVRKKRKKDKL